MCILNTKHVGCLETQKRQSIDIGWISPPCCIINLRALRDFPFTKFLVESADELARPQLAYSMQSVTPSAQEISEPSRLLENLSRLSQSMGTAHSTNTSNGDREQVTAARVTDAAGAAEDEEPMPLHGSFARKPAHLCQTQPNATPRATPPTLLPKRRKSKRLEEKRKVKTRFAEQSGSTLGD